MNFRRVWWQVIFRWYDLWVGFFYDRKNGILYFFPLPCIGIRFWLDPKGTK